MADVQILLVSGSLREGSTNSALLRTAVAIAPAGIATETYDGLASLPHFNPDDDAEGLAVPDPVASLRTALGAADAVLFSAPEYAGALPGSFKNLLEWTVGGHEIYGMPAAWINAAFPGRGENADAELRKVLGYVGADLVEEACVRIPVDRAAIGVDGLVAGADLRAHLAAVLEALATRAGAAERLPG